MSTCFLNVKYTLTARSGHRRKRKLPSAACSWYKRNILSASKLAMAVPLIKCMRPLPNASEYFRLRRIVKYLRSGKVNVRKLPPTQGEDGPGRMSASNVDVHITHDGREIAYLRLLQSLTPGKLLEQEWTRTPYDYESFLKLYGNSNVGIYEKQEKPE